MLLVITIIIITIIIIVIAFIATAVCYYYTIYMLFKHICNIAMSLLLRNRRPVRCSGEASHSPSRAQWHGCRHAAEALPVGARAGGAWRCCRATGCPGCWNIQALCRVCCLESPRT